MRLQSIRHNAVLLLGLAAALVLGVLLLMEAVDEPRAVAAAERVAAQRPSEASEEPPIIEPAAALLAHSRTESEGDEAAPAPVEDRSAALDPALAATVRGRVVDAEGRGVTPAVVELRARARPTESRNVDGNGGFAFDVPPGRVELHVRASSLSDGLLPPWGQEREAYLQGTSPVAPGFFATFVDLEEAAEANVDLRVFRRSGLTGRVLGPSGDPIVGAQIRIRAHEALLTEILADAWTDVSGRYELTDLYPGQYEVFVRFGPRTEPRFRGLTPPPPVPLELPEGRVVESADIRILAGGKAIAGRVVDQDGEPFGGLTLVATLAERAPNSPLATARTAADGLFVLNGLPPAPVRVQVEPGFRPREAVDLLTADDVLPAGHIAEAVEPFVVDLAVPEPTVEAPLIVVRESRPFRYEAQLQLDSAWRAQTGVAATSLRVEATLPATADAPETTVEVPVRPDGSFVWSCETPHAPVAFTITSDDDDAAWLEVAIVPRPFENRRETLLFPSPAAAADRR